MLTDAKIRKIKPPSVDKKSPDKYSDMNGLQLHVFATGRMTWIFAYRLAEKQRSLTLGAYPLLSLQEARNKHQDARKQVFECIDPNEAKKATRSKQVGDNTFKNVALEWYAKKLPTWSESNAKKVLARLEKDIFPFMGKQDISQIGAPELLKTIQRIEKRSVDTAYRALQECGQVFRYGMVTGRNQHDPSPALRGALQKNPTGHFAAIIDPTAFGGLLRVIDGFQGSFVVLCALKLAPLFFVRIGELRCAKWSEVNFEAAEWRYFITKTKQDHIVPLSTQAIDILKELQQVTGDFEYVFTGGRDTKRPMSDGAINAALRRMGVDTQKETTGHGFRATARTMLHERLGVERDVIEHQLGHAVGDSLGRAYNRTLFLEQRKDMMQRWADYLDNLKEQQVIPFPILKQA